MSTCNFFDNFILNRETSRSVVQMIPAKTEITPPNVPMHPINQATGNTNSRIVFPLACSRKC